MRMKLLFISIFLALAGNTIAQKEINMILSVDEKIVFGEISQVKIIAKFENGREQKVSTNYFPGNLSISDSDYNLLLAEDVKFVFLAFSYRDCGKKNIQHDYKIDIKKGWLKNYYYVLHIYNTNKEKYKKIFDPLPGKSYTYEIDYPGGAMKRIRKQKLSTECN